MPVKPGCFDTSRKLLWVALPHLPSEKKEIGINNNPPNHMESVKSRQRKVDRQKRIVGRKEAVMKFSAVFKVFDHQKSERQKRGKITFIE